MIKWRFEIAEKASLNEKYWNCVACSLNQWSKIALLADAINNVKWMRDGDEKLRQEQRQVLALAKRYKKILERNCFQELSEFLLIKFMCATAFLPRSLLKNRSRLSWKLFQWIYIALRWSQRDKTSFKSTLVHLLTLFLSYRLRQHPFASLHVFALVVKLYFIVLHQYLMEKNPCYANKILRRRASHHLRKMIK